VKDTETSSGMSSATNVLKQDTSTHFLELQLVPMNVDDKATIFSQHLLAGIYMECKKKKSYPHNRPWRPIGL
jgi:hypothetical protein